MTALIRSAVFIVCLVAARISWAAPPPQPAQPARPSADLDSRPTQADADAARFCQHIRFVAYSTVEPSGQKVEESISWDDVQQAYIVRGPVLASMLNYPGVAQVPSSVGTSASFQIAIRQSPSNPVDRPCEYGFQESADCDPHGDITYTQIYTGCDLQTLQHVTRLTPDSAGTLQLIDISFADVQGDLSNPLYLSAGSDLRLRVRN